MLLVRSLKRPVIRVNCSDVILNGVCGGDHSILDPVDHAVEIIDLHVPGGKDRPCDGTDRLIVLALIILNRMDPLKFIPRDQLGSKTGNTGRSSCNFLRHTGRPVFQNDHGKECCEDCCSRQHSRHNMYKLVFTPEYTVNAIDEQDHTAQNADRSTSPYSADLHL